MPASRAVLTDGGKPAVLVVDDDPVVSRVIVEVLGREAFDVTVVRTALEALEEVERGLPDVIILDIELPGMSGLELLLRLRQGDCPPVILLTGRSEESDRVLGLDLGADDYVVKPFLPRELAARVRGVLRRQAGAPAASAAVPGAVRLDYGALVIAPLEREVHLHDDLVDLTPASTSSSSTWPAIHARCSPGRSCSTRSGGRRASGRIRPPSPSTSGGCGPRSRRTRPPRGGSSPSEESATASSPSTSGREFPRRDRRRPRYDPRMAEAYDVQEIERKWQARWRDEGTYQVEADDPRPHFYSLCMYPYPSGAAHQGHVRNYTFGDLIVRHRTMQGYAVLSPMGFDSFGLPAENAAIKTGVHPRPFTDARIAELKESIERLGAVYDWRREVRSHDPEYIHWTQWIFLRFLEAGLAYRKQAPVNWCPGCQTVLANEQVLADGTCERSGDVVEKRNLEQWFFKITDYADQLLDDLDTLDWPERVKIMQRNWIGRSEGVEFDLRVAGSDSVIPVFTTRPDTSFGMTYVVLAPEHPLVGELTTPEQRAAVDAFVAEVATHSEVERQSAEGPVNKRGVFTGASAVNPFTGEDVPIYLADYVLMGYGTGAIMAVPGEDQRDWDFAEAYDLPIIQTVQRPEGWVGQAYTGDGPIINSQWLNGLHKAEAIAKAIDWLEDEGHRQAHGELPPARLAAVAATLLGLPDPGRLLPRARSGPRARRRAARAGARRRGVPAHRRVAPALPRRLPAHDLPHVRPARHARDRHHGHLRRLVVVLPALHRPREQRGAVRSRDGGRVAAGRPVHRRHRARHPAPDVRPVLHQGPGRPGRRARRSCASRSPACSPRG